MQALCGEAEEGGLFRVVGHRLLVDEPVSAVPWSAGEAWMLPVGVTVDEIHIALGVESEGAEDDGSGDKCLAAEVFPDEFSHVIEIGFFRVGEEAHAVDGAGVSFAVGEKDDVSGFEGFAFLQAD